MKQKLPPKNVKHARTNTPVSKRSRAAPLLPRRNRTPKVTLVQKEEREREKGSDVGCPGDFSSALEKPSPRFYLNLGCCSEGEKTNMRVELDSYSLRGRTGKNARASETKGHVTRGYIYTKCAKNRSQPSVLMILRDYRL